MLIYSSVLKTELLCRRVGMADEADSKSVVCEHVRVRVPLPAVNKKPKSLILQGFRLCLYRLLGEKMNIPEK